MFVIVNVASFTGSDELRSALGSMWPRSKPLDEKSNACTLYQPRGRSGSGRKVSVRGPTPVVQALVRCQLTQFGRPRSRLYDSAYSGLEIRKLFGWTTASVVALDGLPIAR